MDDKLSLNEQLGDSGMRLAAYQFPVCGNIQDNLQTISKAIDKAAKEKVDLVVFPECALTGYPPTDIPRSSDVDMDAVRYAIQNLQEMVDHLGIHLILGTIAMDQEGHVNRAYLLSPGKAARWYDKRALYGWDEENFKSGNELGVFELDGIKVGIRICFEIRFPEYFRELYLKQTDLDIVLFYDVSDNEDEIRYQMMRSHLITRAVENVTSVLSVNATHPNQTAPTCLINASGRVCKELEKNHEGMLLYNYTKQKATFGELGRRRYSDLLLEVDFQEK